MKTKIIAIVSVLIILSISANCFAAGVYYLPDVTSEMSSPNYWTDETDILMTRDEIEKLNEEINSAGSDYEKITELSARLSEKEAEQDKLMNEWEELSTELEEL